MRRSDHGGESVLWPEQNYLPDYFSPLGEIGAGVVTNLIRSPPEFEQAARGRHRILGLTQEDLAARCGAGKRLIVELEAGTATIQFGKALITANEADLAPADSNGHRPGITTDVSDDPLADLWPAP